MTGYDRCATGEIREKMFEIACLQRGYAVCRPISHLPYDYLIDRGNGWERVQIKAANVDSTGSRRMKIAAKPGKYTPNDIDVLCGIGEAGQIWEYSVEEIAMSTTVSTPVNPKYKTKNWFEDSRLWQ